MSVSRQPKYLRLRVSLVGLFFLAGLVVILFRAAYLQVVCGPALAQKASGQYAKTIHA